MKIHLLAIDLDGTLLTSKKAISPETLRALRAARESAAVHVVLASARPPRTILPFYTQLDLRAPVIAYNGALACEPSSQRVLLHSPVPVKTARDIVALARQMYPRVLVSAEILDRWYTDHLDAAYQTETAKLTRPDVIAPLDEWLTTDVTKLLLLGKPRALAEIRQVLRKRARHQVAMVQTEEYLLQIMHATVSKAQALRVVAADLGVTADQVLAIGDNANDVGMLQWAGVSVAMANGHPTALGVADEVTGHHNDHGVARAVQKWVLGET